MNSEHLMPMYRIARCCIDGQLEGGDLIALEAKYHLTCLTKLRNRHRSLLRTNQESSRYHIEENQKKARAFTELIIYIGNAVEDGTFCFKFSDLRHLYENHLKELGIDTEVNKVRFKEKILSHFKHKMMGRIYFLFFSKECSKF